MRTSPIAFALVATLALCGCSSPATTTDGGGGDAGGGDGGGGGGQDGGLPPTKYVGYVSLSQADAQLAGGQMYKNFNVGATFLQSGSGTGSVSGTTMTDGPCQISIAGDAGAVDAGLPTLLPAGTLTVNGGLVPVSLMPDAQNRYSQNQMGALLWNGGETLTAMGSGSPMGAPAFDLAVTAPSRATMTAPLIAGLGQPTMIPRSTNLAVAWTGGGSGNFVIFLSASGTSVSCAFPASAGSGTVPASALGKLPMGGGTLYANTNVTAQKVVGEWGMYLFASAQAVTPTQQVASGLANFQ